MPGCAVILYLVKTQFSKLVMAPQRETTRPPGAIRKRLNNITAIWNNEQDNDLGIEKVVRLFLASSPFLFPGLYVKELFSRKLFAFEDLAVDGYVLLKIIIPLTILINGPGTPAWLAVVSAYLILETICYVPSLIFASDLINRPRSYRRSMLLVFLNYMEIILGFGVIYSTGTMLNGPLTHWFDPLYFSFMTASTIGYGDLYPVTPLAKMIVSLQSVLFIMFLYIFLNFFSSHVRAKGYFGET